MKGMDKFLKGSCVVLESLQYDRNTTFAEGVGDIRMRVQVTNSMPELSVPTLFKLFY